MHKSVICRNSSSAVVRVVLLLSVRSQWRGTIALFSHESVWTVVSATEDLDNSLSTVAHFDRTSLQSVSLLRLFLLSNLLYRILIELVGSTRKSVLCLGVTHEVAAYNV